MWALLLAHSVLLRSTKLNPRQRQRISVHGEKPLLMLALPSLSCSLLAKGSGVRPSDLTVPFIPFVLSLPLIFPV